MTNPGTTTPIVTQREDTRTDGPMTGAERAVLDHWLDLYRDTTLLKIAGLDARQLTRRAVPPSTLSLMASSGTSRRSRPTGCASCFSRSKTSRTTTAPRLAQDGDFDDVDPSTAAADVARYQTELVTTRANASAWTDLAVPVRGAAQGQAGQPALDPDSPRREVRPPPRPHGPSPRGCRRPHWLLTAPAAHVLVTPATSRAEGSSALDVPVAPPARRTCVRR